jgi:hypothetical protein
VRDSRSPRVLAVLTTIRITHVLREERPSNRSRPFRTPTQASCTTSSATAREDTYMRASLSIVG